MTFKSAFLLHTLNEQYCEGENLFKLQNQLKLNLPDHQHCIHSMPAPALAETTQVRQNLSTLAASELAFPALEQMRERYATVY